MFYLWKVSELFREFDAYEQANPFDDLQWCKNVLKKDMIEQVKKYHTTNSTQKNWNNS